MEKDNMNRRKVLKSTGAVGLGTITGAAHVQATPNNSTNNNILHMGPKMQAKRISDEDDFELIQMKIDGEEVALKVYDNKIQAAEGNFEQENSDGITKSSASDINNGRAFDDVVTSYDVYDRTKIGECNASNKPCGNKWIKKPPENHYFQAVSLEFDGTVDSISKAVLISVFGFAVGQVLGPKVGGVLAVAGPIVSHYVINNTNNKYTVGVWDKDRPTKFGTSSVATATYGVINRYGIYYNMHKDMVEYKGGFDDKEPYHLADCTNKNIDVPDLPW